MKDDRGINKVITDKDVWKKGDIIPVTSKRLVKVSIVSNKCKEDDFSLIQDA